MRRVALITGGGRGIGRATARLAAQAGYDVCIAYRRDHLAAQSSLDACLAQGAVGTLFQANVSDPVQVDALFAHCAATLGAPTLLVNNAGVIGGATRLVNLAPETLQATFATNVFGSIYCSQAAVRCMSTEFGGRGGVIINLSSVAAVQGSPGEYVHYAATKGAIETLTIGLAKEVGPQGIRVNAVRAGTTLTDIHAHAGNPDRPGMVARNAPLRRAATPEDIAEAILWLASDKASFATGAILPVTGGL
ncbi:short-chain dehydrogenase [Pseudoruegeria sp. SK021]|nr:short-chain dehydrogenase [Pseudoruegeria sp. SK021]